ncbi:MAG: hypothetical protein IKK52_06090 [Alphaproteobacteria bacterium]|nr:hypothetical protein [Alphaproteobacteria bacterium]
MSKFEEEAAKKMLEEVGITDAVLNKDYLVITDGQLFHRKNGKKFYDKVVVIDLSDRMAHGKPSYDCHYRYHTIHDGKSPFIIVTFNRELGEKMSKGKEHFFGYNYFGEGEEFYNEFKINDDGTVTVAPDYNYTCAYRDFDHAIILEQHRESLKNFVINPDILKNIISYAEPYKSLDSEVEKYGINYKYYYSILAKERALKIAKESFEKAKADFAKKLKQKTINKKELIEKQKNIEKLKNFQTDLRITQKLWEDLRIFTAQKGFHFLKQSEIEKHINDFIIGDGKPLDVSMFTTILTPKAKKIALSRILNQLNIQLRKHRNNDFTKTYDGKLLEPETIEDIENRIEKAEKDSDTLRTKIQKDDIEFQDRYHTPLTEEAITYVLKKAESILKEETEGLENAPFRDLLQKSGCLSASQGGDYVVLNAVDMWMEKASYISTDKDNAIRLYPFGIIHENEPANTFCMGLKKGEPACGRNDCFGMIYDGKHLLATTNMSLYERLSANLPPETNRNMRIPEVCKCGVQLLALNSSYISSGEHIGFISDMLKRNGITERHWINNEYECIPWEDLAKFPPDLGGKGNDRGIKALQALIQKNLSDRKKVNPFAGLSSCVRYYDHQQKR